MPIPAEQKARPREVRGTVYCPLCTHTVPANVLINARAAKVVPGQKCPRCQSSLDAGYVLHLSQAA